MSIPAQKGLTPPATAPRPAAAGQLAERPIPRLLHQLMRKRVTGCLVVVDQAGDESRVFLREGAPVHVVRPTDADRLDHVVAAAGLVSPDVLRALSAELPPGKRLGEVLVERGLVAEATLADLLKVQMRRKLFRLFHAHRGQFAIYIDAHPYGAGGEFAEMRVDPRCLVLEGIRAAYDEARLRAELAPLTGRRFRLLRSVPASLLEAMGFPASDPTLAALDGAARTLADFPVAGVAPAESLAIVLALLYADLLEAEVTAPAKPVAAAQTGPALGAGSPGPAGKPAVAPGAADTALAARIDELLQRAPSLSHFELLGVAESASPDEINVAYLKRMRDFHPDRIAGRGLRDLAARAAALVARINEANGVLLDPKRRAAYLASRAPGPQASDVVRAVLSAEESFRRGEVFLRKGDHLHAAEAFAVAVRDNPQEPIYRAYAAWSRFQSPGASKDRLVRETLSELLAVAAERPKFALGHHWQGLLHKHLGDNTAAETAFRAAVTEDKNLLDAERELRVLEMRRSKAAVTAAASSEKLPAISAARRKR